MAKITVEFRNKDAVIKKLSSTYPNRIRAAIISSVLERGGDIAVEEAKALVPVDTGALQNTIRVRRDLTSMRVILSAGSGSVDYAGYQEYGTKDKALNPSSIRYLRTLIESGAYVNRRGFVTPPVLYLTRAMYMAKTRISELLKLEIRNVIRQTSGRGK